MKRCVLKVMLVFVSLMFFYQGGAETAKYPATIGDMLQEIVLVNWSKWTGGNTQAADLKEQLYRALSQQDVQGEEAAVLSSLVEKIHYTDSQEVISLSGILQWLQEDSSLQYRCMKRMMVAKEKRPFIAGKQPHFQALLNQQAGNSAIISAIGGLAANQPEQLGKTLRGISDKHYEISFPGGKKVISDIPREGELLVSKWMFALRDGIWPVLFYQAIQQELGSSATAIEVQTLWTGTSPQVKNLKEEDIHSLRELIKKAFEEKAIIQAELEGKSETAIPGLDYQETYAVLRLDVKQDVVVLWHPYAVFFEPEQNEEGDHRGFLMTSGVFQMPLREFREIFSHMIISDTKK